MRAPQGTEMNSFSNLTGLVMPVALSMPRELTVAMVAFLPSCRMVTTLVLEATARRLCWLARSAGRVALNAAPLITADMLKWLCCTQVVW